MLVLPAISFLLLAAHFYRSGVIVGTLSCIAFAALLIVPHRSVPRIAVVGLALGTLEWLRTLFVLASARVEMQLPWLRLAAIVGGVAVLTALSTLVFRHHRLRAFYGTG